MKAREPRNSVTTPARMRIDAGWTDVTIRDISSRGVGLRCPDPPLRGDYIELCHQRNRLVGRVMWSDGESFGVLLSDAIVIDDLLSGRARPRKCRDERRGSSRPAELRQVATSRAAVADIAQNSRHAARVMNFAAVAAMACLGAALAAYSASSVLSHAMDAVTAGLLVREEDVSDS